MRKSTIFISAVLTTFALVILYRVASAYNDSKVAAVPPTATPAPVETEPPAIPEPTDIVFGPVEAAQVAAQVVGNTNLLSAETANYNGVSAYMVTFTNNDVVYVGLDGQILSVQIAPVTPVVVNVPAPTKNKHKNDGGNKRSNSSSSSGEHEDHDDDDDD